MKKLLVALMMTQCVVAGFDDAPRFFTNGHGGYQFFHAAEDQKSGNRRMDSETSFSETIQYLVAAPRATITPSTSTISPKEFAKTTQQINIVKVSQHVPHRLHMKKVLDDDSAENRILKDTTSTAPPRRYRFTTVSALKRQQQVTRKRIVVRKFKPKPKTAEKNKKREISSAGNHRTRAKFTNRHHHITRPPSAHSADGRPKTKQFVRNRGALFTRQPSDTFMQLHLRKVDATTSSTTPTIMQKSMIEKRHLANVRFFNRRKLAN